MSTAYLSRGALGVGVGLLLYIGMYQIGFRQRKNKMICFDIYRSNLYVNQ
jgi:hypothetical protein